MFDELVGRLREPCQYENCILCQQAADAIEELMRRCEQFPYMPPPAWIPVTERLPEKTGIYAVWTAKGFGNHLSASHWDGESWSLRVTHWMPLPTPPKEE